MDTRSEKEIFPELSDSLNNMYEEMLRTALVVAQESLVKNEPNPYEIIKLLHFFQESHIYLSKEILEKRVYPVLYDTLMARMKADSEQPESHRHDLLKFPIQMLSDESFLRFIQQDPNVEERYYFNLFKLAAAQTITLLDQEIDDSSLIKQVLEIPGCFIYLNSNVTVQYILDEIAMRKSSVEKNRKGLTTDIRPNLTTQPQTTHLTAPATESTSTLSSSRLTPASSSSRSSSSLSTSSSRPASTSLTSPSNSSLVTDSLSEKETDDDNEEDEVAGTQQQYQHWLMTNPKKFSDELIRTHAKIESSASLYFQCGISETTIKILKNNLSLTKHIQQVHDCAVKLENSKKSVSGSDEETLALAAALHKYNRKKFLAIQSRNLIILFDTIIHQHLIDKDDIGIFITDVNKAFKTLGKFHLHYEQYQKLKNMIAKSDNDMSHYPAKNEKLLDGVVDKIEEELARYPGLKDKIKLGIGGEKQNRPLLVSHLTQLWEIVNIQLAAYTRNIEVVIYKKLNDLPDLQIEFKEFMNGKHAGLSKELDKQISLYMSDAHKKKFISSLKKIKTMRDDLQHQDKGFLKLASNLKLNIPLPTSDQVTTNIQKTQFHVEIYQYQHELIHHFSRTKEKKVKYEKAMKDCLTKLHNNGNKLIAKCQEEKPADKKSAAITAMTRRFSKSHINDNKVRSSSSSSSATITKRLISTTTTMPPPVEAPPIPQVGAHVEKPCDEYLKKISPLLNKCAGCKDSLEITIVPIEKDYRRQNSSDLEKIRRQLKLLDETISSIQKNLDELNEKLKNNFSEDDEANFFDDDNNFVRSEINTLKKFVANPERYFSYLDQYKKMQQKFQEYSLRFNKILSAAPQQEETLPSYSMKM